MKSERDMTFQIRKLWSAVGYISRSYLKLRSARGIA